VEDYPQLPCSLAKEGTGRIQTDIQAPLEVSFERIITVLSLSIKNADMV